MNKYLFLYRKSSTAEHAPSPEELQQQLAQWQAWKTKFKEHVVDMGDGLKPSGLTLNAEGVTDGPFAEAKEIIAGFSVIGAQSYDQALQVARECPFSFVPNFNIEIREMMGY